MSRSWESMFHRAENLREVAEPGSRPTCDRCFACRSAYFERMIGCIYLDSTNVANRFHEDHLQLMAGVAGISAVALDNARRLQWLEQENQRLMTEIRHDDSLVGEGARMKEVFQFLGVSPRRTLPC